MSEKVYLLSYGVHREIEQILGGGEEDGRALILRVLEQLQKTCDEFAV
jgi:hypothetical protein